MKAKQIGKFIIINLQNMDFFKTHERIIKFYETEKDALIDAFFYELENVHILEIKNYYDEEENDKLND